MACIRHHLGNDGSGQREVKTFILKAQLETMGYIRGEQKTVAALDPHSPPPLARVGRGQTLESKIKYVPPGGSSFPGGERTRLGPQFIQPSFPHQISPTAPSTPRLKEGRGGEQPYMEEDMRRGGKCFPKIFRPATTLNGPGRT